MQGIKYHRNAPRVRCHFLEQFYPLRRHFIRKKRDPGEVLTWSSKRHGKSRPHRAIANATDNGYATITCLEQWLDNITANGEQNVGPLRDKFGGQFGKPIRITICIPEDDFDVAVIKLTTSSNLVGCSTGRSAGFAPLGIRSMKYAVRRTRLPRSTPRLASAPALGK